MSPMQRLRRRRVQPHAGTSDEHLVGRAVTQGSVLQLTRSFLLGQLTYTTPVVVEGQTLDVQVDTSSSDFWLASDKCGTPSCVEKEGYQVDLFSDNEGLETGETATVNYLSASASGPIVQSNVTLGSTVIPGQAFMTANDVENEPLGSMQATGMLGLGLPLGSIIQEKLSSDNAGNNNSINDFGRTGSVLPGLWRDAPQGQRFFGLGLQRLPSDGGNGNSTVTFGGYDPAYVSTSQQSNITWEPVLADDDDGAITRWKVAISDISVKVNGSYLSIPLVKTGYLGTLTAILDSGAPLNYANENFLNALYGAFNVGPSLDSSKEYYIDCRLQMDMTLTVNGAKIPIHPLDSSLKYSNQAGMNSNDGCIGSFQVFGGNYDVDSVKSQIVLGAPFLRSVYSLYSCDPNPRNNTQTGWCSNPWIGLYPLYGSQASLTGAQSEFEQVRVRGQKLGDNSSVDGATTKSSGFSSGAKIAVGVICGLLAILIVMAGLLLWLKRKRSKMEPSVLEGTSHEDEEKDVITGAGSVDWTKMTENERQKARELAKLHGHFIDESDGDAGRSSPLSSLRPEDNWDISSKGYWEARAIKNDYLRRERDRDSSAAAKSLSTSHRDTETLPYSDSEAHEMVAPRPHGHDADSPSMTPYKDLPSPPFERYV